MWKGRVIVCDSTVSGDFFESVLREQCHTTRDVQCEHPRSVEVLHEKAKGGRIHMEETTVMASVDEELRKCTLLREIDQVILVLINVPRVFIPAVSRRCMQQRPTLVVINQSGNGTAASMVQGLDVYANVVNVWGFDMTRREYQYFALDRAGFVETGQGDSVIGRQLRRMPLRVEWYCLREMMNLSQSEKVSFVGTQCVVCNKEDTKRSLSKYDYVYSRKIDGVRYLMLIDNGGHVFFMNRKIDVISSYTSEYAPDRVIPISTEFYGGSLIDVELTESTRTIHVIDVIAFRRQCVRALCLGDRLSKLRESRFYEQMNDRKDGLRFKEQQYRELCELKLEDESLYNENPNRSQYVTSYDGVIFTPSKKAYRLGRDYGVFKWKPPQRCTVDLILGEDGQSLFAYGNAEKPHVVCGRLKSGPIAEKCVGGVYECQYAGEGLWAFPRLRTDKTNCNTHDTVMNTIQIIREGLRLRDIADMI